MPSEPTTTIIPTAQGRLVATAGGPVEPRGSCLIAPPFGLSAEAMTIVLDQLIERGVSTAILDPRNHVGLSSGEIADFTMSGYAGDCLQAITHLRPDCVVGISLGARAMIRSLSLAREVPAALYLLPVVDVRATLRAVFGIDHFQQPVDELPDVMPVLDQEVKAAPFRWDCELHNFVEPEGTVADLADYGGRVTVLAGDRDPWVDFTQLASLTTRVARNADIRLEPLELDTHVFHDDIDLALRMVARVVDAVDRIMDELEVAA